MAIEIKNSIVSDVVGTLYDKMGVNDYTSPKKVKAQLKDCAFSNDLIVNVSSGGGDVFAASEIYTMLRDSGKNVTVNIQGLAASAASVISMAGDTVRISPTAQIMIHSFRAVLFRMVPKPSGITILPVLVAMSVKQ